MQEQHEPGAATNYQWMSSCFCDVDIKMSNHGILWRPNCSDCGGRSGVACCTTNSMTVCEFIWVIQQTNSSTHQHDQNTARMTKIAQQKNERFMVFLLFFQSRHYCSKNIHYAEYLSTGYWRIDRDDNLFNNKYWRQCLDCSHSCVN